MASTFSSLLGFEIMGSGENSGTWGTKTSNNLTPLVESAICGRATVTFSSDANTTISISDGADSTGRYYILNVTSGVSLTATRNVVAPLRAGKTYVVFNNTTGGQSIQIIGASGTGITVPNGKTGFVYTDGTNYKQMIDWATGMTLAGHTTIEGVTTAGATGTGNLVFATSPTLVTPALGVPASGTLTNCTGLPIAGGGKPTNRFTSFTNTTTLSTVSLTKVMGGFGATWALTPAATGKVRVTMVGTLQNGASATSTLNLNYGTGTAPISGAAVTGTAGITSDILLSGNATIAPVTIVFELSGLTLSTAYWFDIALQSSGGTTGICKPCSVIIEEF